MALFAIRALLSGLIVALVALVARRNPAAGALIASLPLVSLLGMIWLWHDTRDTVRLAAHAEATFWYVLPSLPMFLAVPALLRHGVGFWRPGRGLRPDDAALSRHGRDRRALRRHLVREFA
jgi:hypothetical protein